jgi:hypothetical protein
MKLHDCTCATLISLIMGLCFGVSAWAGTTTITGENGKSGTVETNRTKDGNTVNVDHTGSNLKRDKMGTTPQE